MNQPIFHLAFPIQSVDETVSFYRDRLGFRIDLIEEKRCLIDFFGHQLVAHVTDEARPERPSLYPRHFGVIVPREKEYEDLLRRCENSDILPHGKPMHRFEGSPREHRTFFIADPFNNMLEFKWYKNPEYIFKSDPNTPTLDDFFKQK